jgi:hypothetical protein
MDRATDTLVRHVAKFAGLTVYRGAAGYELMDRHGTITEPVSAADVLCMVADSAASRAPIIF